MANEAAVKKEESNTALAPVLDGTTYLRFMEENIKDVVYRSREIRDIYWSLRDRAKRVLQDVLDMDLTEKTLPTVAKVAMHVLDTQIMEAPKLQLLHLTTSRDESAEMLATPIITPEELISAAQVALRSEMARARELKSKQDIENNVIEGEIVDGVREE